MLSSFVKKMRSAQVHKIVCEEHELYRSSIHASAVTGIPVPECKERFSKLPPEMRLEIIDLKFTCAEGLDFLRTCQQYEKTLAANVWRYEQAKRKFWHAVFGVKIPEQNQ